MHPTTRRSDSPRLTVAMIVRDAEHHLEPTLRCAGEVADELLVVDTGSLDYSRDLAGRYTDRVLGYRWHDDFSAARNFTADQATGDWIFWLDAGETLSSEMAGQLRRFVDHEAATDTAYRLYVHLPPREGDSSLERAARVRLHPRTPEARFVGRVREELDTSSRNPSWKFEDLPWPIRRGEREHEPDVQRTRAERNLHLASLALAEESNSAKWLNVQGEAYQQLEDFDRARQAYRQVCSLSRRPSPDHLEAYYGLLTCFPENEAAPIEEQLSICLEAVEMFPQDAQLLCAMGNLLQAQGRIDLALRAFQAAYEVGSFQPELWHLADLFEVAAACASVCHQLLKRDDKAYEMLRQAMQRYPRSSRLCRRMVEVCISRQRVEEALEHASHLPNVEHREALQAAIRGACLGAARNWVPAAANLRTAFEAGCRDPLCLRWLTLTYLALEDFASAERAAELWQEQQPGNPEVFKYLHFLKHERTKAPQPPTEQKRKVRFDSGQPAINPVAASQTSPQNVTNPLLSQNALHR